MRYAHAITPIKAISVFMVGAWHMIHRDIDPPKPQSMIGRCVLCGRDRRFLVPHVNRKTGVVNWACGDVRNCEVWQPDFAKNWNDGRTE